MTLQRAAAALLMALAAALLQGGCAMLRPDSAGNGPVPETSPMGPMSPATSAGAAASPVSGPRQGGAATVTAATPAAAASAAGSFTLVTPQEFEQQSPTLGVRVEIDAPPELKALLQKNLDLLRLSSLTREELDDSEWARLVDASPAQVRELLQTEGYFLPRVELDRTPRRAAGEADVVRLRVQPGPRAQVGRVTLEVEGDLQREADAGAAASPDIAIDAGIDAGSDKGAAKAAAQARLQRWRAGWSLPSGAVFRNPAWSDAKAGALARLRGAGYANAVWIGTGAEVDPLTQQVRLFLVADSGSLFRYGEVQIEGLARHDSQTVANLLNARRGTPVTETLLLDFQDRLQKSGLFENVSVTLDNDPARAESARILVRLAEAPIQVYTVGLGISANTGARASLEHTYRRVFGYAASARNKFEFGQKRQAWEGEVSSHPGDNLYRNLVGGAVENLESDSDTVLSQRLRVGRTQDTQRIERLYFVEGERSRRTTAPATNANDTAASQRNSAFALSLNYHGIWRELDNVILPTRGYSFNGQSGIGHSRGTGAEPGIFTRAYGRLTGYLPFAALGSSWYGQARVELGHVFLGSRMVVPDSLKFRAGGDDSVRGYGYRTLGPLVDGAVGGGDSLVTASLELARPIVASMPSLWGAIFIDAGNAADSFRALQPRVGYGAGVRWRSPVGPLRVDYAWAPAVHSGRLHFSVGITF